MKSVSFYTLGCRLNQAETAIIEKGFEQKGYKIVNFGQTSDIVVINTCTVTENGDADARRLVNKINQKNPLAKIALIGCQAQTQGKRLLEMPNVQWVVGNALKMELATLLDAVTRDEPLVMTPAIKKESFTISVAGVDSTHTRANLKIQDGCDFFCSFCEIPFARGRARSRVYDDILRAAAELAKAGHREIVLTGINVGTYRYEDKTLLDVINGLEMIKELERIRISSIEPTTIPDQLLDKMAQNQKLCRHLHIPIQYGEDKILKAMNRKYTVAELSEYINKVHRLVPNICIGTDVMVGFPGETEEQFNQSYDVLKSLPFGYFHVFSYSDRNHNKSRNFPNKIAKEIIDKRSRRMRELSAQKKRCYLEQFIGQTATALFEQKKKGFWTGLTDTYIRVYVRSEWNLQNRFAPVRLQRIENQVMMGQLS